MFELERKIESLAMEHLSNYHSIVLNGLQGTDQIYPHISKKRALSPIYSYLAGSELIALVEKVNLLHDKAKKGIKEEDIGTLIDPFLYFYRSDFFNKFALDALGRDESSPNRIHTQHYFDEIRISNVQQKEEIYMYFENIQISMELMFGESWKEDKKFISQFYNFYAHYWRLNQHFLDLETKIK